MAKWLLIPLTASALCSCKKEEPPTKSPPTTERKLPSPTPIEPVADLETPQKKKEPATPDTPNPQPKETAGEHPKQTPPASSDNNGGYPSAVPYEGQKGYVKSPYSGKVIDVRDMPSGTLVQDPTFPASEKKYFRVP